MDFQPGRITICSLYCNSDNAGYSASLLSLMKSMTLLTLDILCSISVSFCLE